MRESVGAIVGARDLLMPENAQRRLLLQPKLPDRKMFYLPCPGPLDDAVIGARIPPRCLEKPLLPAMPRDA